MILYQIRIRPKKLGANIDQNIALLREIETKLMQTRYWVWRLFQYQNHALHLRLFADEDIMFLKLEYMRDIMVLPVIVNVEDLRCYEIVQD